MIFYSFSQYLKYRIKAKTRHGVHSPFVYAFIEQVIKNKGPLASIAPIDDIGLTTRQQKMIARICEYVQCKEVLSVVDTGQLNTCSGLLIPGNKPDEWEEMYNSAGNINEQAVIIVTDIHKSEQHSIAWRKLYSRTSVRLSIDLFDVGVLLYRKEFKEKQHFILK
ncbi:MAG: hypothetical protein H0X33_11950 [Taibaiella sp.]|nr:hypothetical protein [Taibaiella sp.]